jgi:hypothetical protein
MVDTEFITHVKKYPNIGEIINYTTYKYPKWIVDYGDKFTTTFDFLNNRWENLMKNVNTAKILLVSKLYKENSDDDEVTKNLFFVSQLLISTGFLLRKNNEYTRCKNCNCVFPTVEIQKQMLSQNLITKIHDQCVCIYTC